MTLREKIKVERKRLGLRADDLAEMVGVSRSTMFRIERGETRKVSIEVVDSLSNALGVSLGYLLGMEERDQTIIKGDKTK